MSGNPGQAWGDLPGRPLQVARSLPAILLDDDHSGGAHDAAYRLARAHPHLDAWATLCLHRLAVPAIVAMAKAVLVATNLALVTKRVAALTEVTVPTEAIVLNAKTGVPASAIPPSAHSAMPKSMPKWRCANWPRKPMANH